MNNTINPDIIPPSAHHISLSAVSPAAVKVAEQLQQAGYRAYLVGGCVRDLLLQRRPKDFDVATDALPEQVREVFRSCRLIGRRFRLAHVRIGRETIEVATFRAAPVIDEFNETDDARISAHGQVTRDNIYGNIEQDAMRRDFTVNALYYDPSDQTVVDYVGGVKDLGEKKLRPIGNASERFREDPVRMLRAMRFSAKLGFPIDTEIEDAIRDLASLLHHVPPARMLDEVIKLFHSGYALQIFDMLRAHGLFRYIFPFTEQCIVDGQPSLPALALANTDRRIQEDKPVIPAFLFASLLWEPLRADMNKLMDGGSEAHRAFMTAANDVIRDQNQHVSIPRRIGAVVHEIWTMQNGLERRPPGAVLRLLQHQRFRAAYDFLLLRSELGEVERALVDWWTRIQTASDDERRQMVNALGKPRGSRRRRRRRQPSQQSSPAMR